MFNNFTDRELKNEKWRDVDGYDGEYQVSDLGRVRSHKSGEWKVLKGGKMKNGYLNVSLWKDGREKRFYVHRLVAQSFIPNCDDSKTIINHRDECKQNNRVSNIEYCDRQYNNTYNDIHYRRKNGKLLKVKDLYNPNLSYRQNLELFKENGVECSKNVIFNLRNDLGLTKHYIPRKKTN